MQRPRGREPFDRRDRRAIGLDGETRARSRRDAIEEHRARAALTRVTADFGARQSAELAEEVDEQETRFDFTIEAASVNRDADGNLHAGTSRATRKAASYTRRGTVQATIAVCLCAATRVEARDDVGETAVAADRVEVGQPAVEQREQHVVLLDCGFAERQGTFVVA